MISPNFLPISAIFVLAIGFRPDGVSSNLIGISMGDFSLFVCLLGFGAAGVDLGFAWGSPPDSSI